MFPAPALSALFSNVKVEYPLKQGLKLSSQNFYSTNY